MLLFSFSLLISEWIFGQWTKPLFFSVKAFIGEDLLDLHKQQSFTNACKNNGIAHVNKPSAIHLYINAHTNSHAYTQA